MRWLVSTRSLALVVVWTALNLSGQAQPLGMGQTKSIEIALEDPRSPRSRALLDLDAPKVFEYGASTPEDYATSSRWMVENGIDLMCDSRAPVEGFAVFNLAIAPITDPADIPLNYSALMSRMEGKEAKSFGLISAAENQPRMYLFRTSDRAVGVLEVLETTTSPSGLRLRISLVRKPAPPALPMDPAAASRSPLAARTRAAEVRLLRLHGIYLENHPQIIHQKQLVDELHEQLAKEDQSPPNPPPSDDRTIERTRLVVVGLEIAARRAELQYGTDSQYAKQLRAMTESQRKILNRLDPPTNPATQPGR